MGLRAVALGGAVVGLIVSVTIAVSSYLPFIPPVPDPLVFLCFVGIFPTFGVAVIRRVIRQRGRLGFDLTTLRWSAEAAWIAALGVFAFVSFFVAMAQLPGQPERHEGGYYFNDHGSLEPTDRAGYEKALRAQERIFSAIPAVFYGVAVVAWRGSGVEEE